MAKVTRFDRSTAKSIRSLVNAELVKLGKRLGVDFHVGNCSFMDNSMSYKLVVSRIGKDGEVHTPEADSFKLLATMHDLKPTDLGRSFTSGGARFTVVGLKPKSRKYPILCKRDDGRQFKFGADRVKYHLSTDKE